MFKVSNTKDSFNSLQTGKCIARLKIVMVAWQVQSFNSLQTGKCIASIPQLIRNLE